MQVGDVIRFERTFTNKEVKQFTAISGDEGVHHIQPDDEGRLMVQGLLTATLPTKIGGEYNVLARTINFEFLKPVFTNDTILCEVTIEQYEEDSYNRKRIHTSFSCTNQHSIEVLKGSFSGVIK